MDSHEEKARKLHKDGNNCSKSLHTAFSGDMKLKEDFPEPRSIEGKCGALLVSEKILKELGQENKIEDFEKEFIKKFGSLKCIELMKRERRCNDYVGECAKMIDDIVTCCMKELKEESN